MLTNLKILIDSYKCIAYCGFISVKAICAILCVLKTFVLYCALLSMKAIYICRYSQSRTAEGNKNSTNDFYCIVRYLYFFVFVLILLVIRM